MSRVQKFQAPEGKVYDYKEPKMATIIEIDGTEIQQPEHLYAKYLFLGKFDDINNYVLIDDPKGE